MRRLAICVFTAVTCFAWGGGKTIDLLVLNNAHQLTAGADEEVEGVGNLRRLRYSSVEELSFTESEDGRQVMMFRVPVEGGAARLFFKDVALPAGAEITVSGVTESGDVLRSFGPITGAGPLQTGEFWTDALPGALLAIEYKAGEENPGTLPFDLVGIATAATSDVPMEQFGQHQDKQTGTTVYRGHVLSYEVKDGLAMFEGDIELGTPAELAPAPAKGKSNRRDATVISATVYRWPNGTMPYAIDPTVPNQTRITSAITHWNSKLAGHVRIVPRTTETAYVYFARSASGCSSTVGRLGMKQNIQISDACSSGNIIHEIGHAFGLWHEQSREDRNSHVRVILENVLPGMEHNFNQQIYNGDDVGSYDYGSIMHYPANSFSSNGKATIETIPAGLSIGQRSSLSAGDINAMRLLYPAPIQIATTTPVTVTTLPAGLPIVVDGAVHTSPAVFEWAVGSVHTLTAGTEIPVDGTRHRFSKWSNGGAAQQTITTPSKTATYRADYITFHAVTFTSSNGGSLAATPVNADGFYRSAQTVYLTATPAQDSCFVNWTGIVSTLPASTLVRPTAPLAVSANFQPGSVWVDQTPYTVPALGGTVSVSIKATSGCLWSIGSGGAAWVSYARGRTGRANSVLVVTVLPNTTGEARSTSFEVNGQQVTIQQSAL